MDITEQKLSAIHSIAKTAGGDALIEMLNSSIEGSKEILSRIDPWDVRGIAKQQATAEICQGFKAFLESDLDTLLTEYGIEKEEDDA